MRAGTLRAASAILLFFFVFLSIFLTNSHNSITHQKQQSHRTQKRALDDAAWKDAVDKGKVLADPDCAVVESVFTDSAAFADNGWFQRTSGRLHPDLSNAFDALGFSTAKDDNMAYFLRQDKEGETKVDYNDAKAGTKYKNTGATFLNTLNKKNGVLVAIDNRSPSSLDKQGSPPLKRWSDAMGLVWKDYAGDDVKNINYIFRHHVKEANSQPLIDRVLSGMTPPLARDKMTDWPGIEFSLDTDAGKALLSTPGGLGAAYFLYQHRAMFGRKKIVSVNLFLAKDGWLDDLIAPTIAFKIQAA